FEVAQDDRAAENVGYLPQSPLHGLLYFVSRELIERSAGEIFDFDLRLARFGFSVDGDVFLEMALEPAAIVESFANGDAIKPGLEGAALAKTANSFEGFQENFLSGIGGVCGIPEHSQDEVVDRPVVVGDEPVEGG